MMLASRYVDERCGSRCLGSRRANSPSCLQPKMIYASSKEALKRSLTGIATELQANDSDDIEHDTILKVVSKGTAA